MNSTVATSGVTPEQVGSLLTQLQQVTAQIAPNWPLDQMIAVNPYWPLRHQPIEEVAARLKALSGIDLLLPAVAYVQMFTKGQISPYALQQALSEAGQSLELQSFVLRSQTLLSDPQGIQSLAMLYDQQQSEYELSLQQELNSHMSQFCAWYFQQQDRQTQALVDGDLYQQYQQFTAEDRGLDLLLGTEGLHHRYAALPSQINELMWLCQHSFNLPEELFPLYAEGLQRQLNGWASWMAYQHWQANLQGHVPTGTLDLLAIQLGWELVLFQQLAATEPSRLRELKHQWLGLLCNSSERLAFTREQQQYQFIWWRAAEITYQHQLRSSLLTTAVSTAKPPQLQAVFCIDVRSEVIRRALEGQSDTIQTIGFAGFFGLPLQFELSGTPFARPQLPGLLAPVMTARPRQDPQHQVNNARQKGHWQRVGLQATSSFPIVESSGWLALPKLLQKTLFPSRQVDLYGAASATDDWVLEQDGKALTLLERATLARKILQLMGFTTFAQTVLLVGHGSQSANNLHAACLDCGACGGQSGEVNVRILAALLNDPAVRIELAAQKMLIPTGTTFVPALHNTTTDEIVCFAEVPTNVEQWLHAASHLASVERHQRNEDPRQKQSTAEAIAAELRRKSLDWSETRPEWGLADNAAFVIAPRSWTRLKDLQGRVFLHDYLEAQDTDGSTLELLLTAPMIVTHWINMQYNASVTDPAKFGSGNKVLHNAVGGHIGVFEGQGGDLRIGLPLQSVHNGQRWMHQPLRLTVVVAASEPAILAILDKHADVRALVDHGWLYLWQWTEQGIRQLKHGHWIEVE